VAEVIQQIGAYAGFAAIVGLAVLSALYFSQARDVRRLREWAARSGGDRAGAAGRAAESASSGDGRSASQSPGGAENSLPEAAAGTAAPATNGPRSQRSPAAAALRAGQPSAGAYAASTQVGRRAPTRPPAPAPGAGDDSGRRTGGRTGGGAPRPEPRAAGGKPERSSLPYVALAIVGVLIVVGAAAFAVGLIGGREDPDPGVRADAPATQPQARVDPASVTFSVLNGTGVDGLAKQVADELEAAGYRRGNVTNASEQKAESAVLYAQGARAEAQAVARELDVSQIEPADPRSRSLAGDSTVIVVVGGDQTR
jgi:hypothetical protein